MFLIPAVCTYLLTDHVTVEYLCSDDYYPNSNVVFDGMTPCSPRLPSEVRVIRQRSKCS